MIRVVIALMDLMHGIGLKPITETVDLRTTISAYIAHAGHELNESLTSE